MKLGIIILSYLPQKWIEKTNAIGIISKSRRYGVIVDDLDEATGTLSWIRLIL